MNRDRDVAEHGLGTRGGDDEARIVFRTNNWIGNLVERAHLFIVFRLFVAERRHAARTPVDDAVAAIDQPPLVELYERFSHRARQFGRQCVRGTVPIG